MMLGIVRGLLVVAVCLLVPVSAQAATPFTAGTGNDPSVAVGDDGVGHVAWVTDGANARVGYCRVIPGGSSCNRTDFLEFGVGSTAAHPAGRATVYTPSAGKVVVVAGCWNCPTGTQDRVYRWISTNNGDSFVAPLELGSEMGTNGFGTWLDVGAGIFVAANSSRVKAQDGGDPGTGVQYATGGVFVYGPEVARVPATNKLVAATNDLEVVKYGVYVGDSLLVGDINAAIGWSIDRTLSSPEADNGETALDSGPNGVFLSYRSFVANNSHVGLRRFDPATNTFGGPTYVEGADPIDDNSLDYPDSFQDPSGRIHVVWRTLYGGGRLRYTVSNPSGTSFSTPATLARSESITEPEVAAGPAGTGFVTWTPGSSGAIRVVPIAPEPESGLSPTPPDTSPPGVSGFEIGDTSLRPGQRAKFSFRSSEAGLAVLTIEKKFRGRKVKRRGRTRCVSRRKRGRKPNCRGFRRIGEIRQAVTPGLNTIEFGGRVAGRKLGPGKYRASLVITDSAGHVSRTERLNFRVTRSKAKRKRPRR